MRSYTRLAQASRALLILAAILLLNQQPSEAAPKSENGLKVHEWGTFTSVQGSDGNTLEGLHHEEEALPSFVHNLDFTLEALRLTSPAAMASGSPLPAAFRCPVGCKSCCKGMCCDSFTEPNQTLRVTQKMETPVLYFYSSAMSHIKVDVTVDFPMGLISQYYPAPTSVLPLPHNITELRNGQIQYSQMQVLGIHAKASVPVVEAGNVYAPARETASNHVRMAGETEKFIFYRGLGNFKTSLNVGSTRETVTVRDAFGRGIPYLLAVNIRDGKGAFKELGRLGPNGTMKISAAELSKDLTPTTPIAEFEQTVGPFLVKNLMASDLFEDEAKSMVNTWKLSYFHTEGLRILYILPRGETDVVLPIQISPEPVELVRTLVGRVEILLKSEEEQLLALVTEAAAKNDASALSALGRFREPKLRRLLQLTSDYTVTNFINANL